MATASRLALPQRKPSYRFALTPLADAMFQLLIFFMLSSSLTPYSLLTLKSAPPAAEEGAAAPSEDAPAAPPQAEAAPRDTALWTVESGTLIVGGQSFGYEALPDLAAALGSVAAPADVILILRRSARVQDVTTILAALQLASVASVQVTTAGGG